ncbi:sulfur carrier protein ThiS [Acidocella sp.]|uniref:sulfur carrier protein ThiS n=1 Tax=Acidocella sp. TaxID=50710 RepID=UPI0026165429|nr:sulfur carrier protein ThiS [Acidocella sp.]
MSEIAEEICLTVNGDALRVAAGLTVAGLIARLELDTRKVAVERNLEIVPRSAYATVRLAPGDRLEIVHFIGGG